MITKERLEELIEQGATVWNVYVNEIILQNNEVRYSDGYYGEKSYIKDNNLIIESWGDEDINLMYSLDQLFETKEEAEWHKEFGCIWRMERLELPTWEEFEKTKISVKFRNKETKYSMYVFVKNKNTNNCRIIIYADGGEQDWMVFEMPLTKENYTLACRKCKELFLGKDS